MTFLHNKLLTFTGFPFPTDNQVHGYKEANHFCTSLCNLKMQLHLTLGCLGSVHLGRMKVGGTREPR